ncbi:glutathione S-transferase family protein [Puniceibacterium confluentis]|uniref:glutathione S-transferase family protein n=2 Tax=Puniceibacterium confluentis TaxID=1958944 RepID=UPI0011B5F0FA|nr:glutathione S-transferase family protein [Puniceibacterium confluentis]
MITLYHSPRSRSSRIVQLVHEMGLDESVDIRDVTIPRMDGSGQADPSNPHPEGKVPLLVHDGVEIRESNAIMLYLTDLFPGSDLGVPVGHPLRGRYLSWLAYYGNVVEPVYVIAMSRHSHAAFDTTFRDVTAVETALAKALEADQYLCGNKFTAADLLLASPYAWMPDFLPAAPAIRDWFGRCMSRPARKWMEQRDANAAA